MQLIGFDHPHFLLFLPGLIPLVLWSRASNADLPLPRKRAVLILRMFIYLLLVFALAGFRFYLPTTDTAVVFLVDHSESAPAGHLDFARSYIKKSLALAQYGDTTKVAFFGENVNLDQVIEGEGKVAPFSTIVKAERTDIAQALSFAQAILPRNANRKIVLLSDGNENSGDAEREAIMIGSRNTEIVTVPYPAGEREEVFVKSLSLPETSHLNEPFDLRVTLESTIDTKTKMNIFLNGSYLASEMVSLHKGENIFFIPQKARKPGTYSYEVLIEPARDSIAKNNRATAVTFIKGKPRILYISDYDRSAGPLAGVLERAGMDVVTGSPGNIPADLAEMRNYSSLILANVSALSLAPRKMSMIKNYVQDLGGGLIMIGGLNSFGIGGYFGTPIEEVLPVDMDVRKKKILPATAVVLVIDKSGSMAEEQGGKEKIAMAREAAIVTLEFLSPLDEVGVVAFDSASKWIVTLQKATDKKRMIDEIASIRAGGGTDLYSPLASAINELKESKASIKHIIVLSDGRTEPGNFDRLLADMNKNNFTLSTISIGQDADIPFMEKIAQQGKGRSYYTDDASMLPRIFLKDTFIASRSAILEETFMPVISETHPALAGIDFREMPHLKGYCITAEKPLSSVALTSPKKDPLLALWRSGLGKSVAFTSDEGEKWATQWQGWGEFSPFWLQLTRWTLPSTSSENFSVKTERNGDLCTISAEAVDNEGGYVNFLQFTGRIVTPEMESFEVSLRQWSPGKYSATFPVKSTGNYLVNVIEQKGGMSQAVAFSVPYSPEYSVYENNTYLMGKIADVSHGKFGTSPEEIFAKGRKKAYIPRDAWESLLVLALLLFPFDVALRRVFLPEGWLKKYFPKPHITLAENEVTPSVTLSTLKSRKKEISREMTAAQTESGVPGSFYPGIAEKPHFPDEREEATTAAGQAPRSMNGKPVPPPEIEPSLSHESLTYLERLKQAKRKATPEEKK
jgi:Mg-chelatase subunit ChlD